jgi:hypothetical protein
MDAKLQGEGGVPPTWDFFVQAGTGGADIVPMISGDVEALQEVNVACTLVLGGVPQVPAIGVDHLGFLGGTVPFATLDAQIRKMLANVGRTDYYPDYNIVGGGLAITPRKVAL